MITSCVWIHSLYSGLVMTLLLRPLGVSVVTTWPEQHGSDKKWYLWAMVPCLSAIFVLSHSVLVFIFSYISVWLTFSASDAIIFFHFIIAVFFLSFLQLRLVRYAVPIAMIGCLYYKVWHFLGGLCSSLYWRSHYRAEPVCTNCVQRYENRKRPEMEIAEENDNKQLDHNGIPNYCLYFIYFAVGCLNGCHIHYYIQCGNEMLCKIY